MKEFVGLIAIILSFVGYLPYIRDVLSNKTNPHILSWIVWNSITFITFAVQLSAGAGFSAITTLATGLITCFITILSLKNGKKDIQSSDFIFLVLAVISLFLWIITKEPLLSTIILSITSVISFIPTFRKSWNKPEQETLFTWELNTFRHFLTILAIQNYNFVTVLYPITWVILNGGFSILLITRRKALYNQIS